MTLMVNIFAIPTPKSTFHMCSTVFDNQKGGRQHDNRKNKFHHFFYFHFPSDNRITPDSIVHVHANQRDIKIRSQKAGCVASLNVKFNSSNKFFF